MIAIGLFLIAVALYAGTKRHGDQSDLSVATSSAAIPPGHSGTIAVRVINFGPDGMQHSVTFTVTAGQHLTIAGPGSVAAQSPDTPPDMGCRMEDSGQTMTCDGVVSLSVKKHLTWWIPVRVAADTPAKAPLHLTVSAVGSSKYTDPEASNNTTVGFTVVAGPRGSRPVGSHPTTASPSTHPPSSAHSSHPASTSSHPGTSTPTGTQASGTQASGSASSSTGAKKIQGAADKALAPITIALWLLVGLVAIVIGALVFVARRQQQVPLDYIAPRRDKLH